GERNPLRLENARLAIGSGDNVGRSFLRVKRELLLRVVQAGGELAREILFHPEHAETFARPFAHFPRIRAHETRGDHHVLAGNGEIEGEMVALGAPGPGAVRLRFPKNAEVVKLRIAVGAAALL